MMGTYRTALFGILVLLLATIVGCSSDSGNADPTTDTGADAGSDVTADLGTGDTGTTPDTGNTDTVDTECEDDALGNTSTTSPAAAGDYDDLVICPSTTDYFQVDLEANTAATVEAVFTHTDDGDIDLWLWEDTLGGTDEVVDAAEGTEDNETLTFTSGDTAATFFVGVVAYTYDAGADPAYQRDGTNTYSISFTYANTCQWDDDCDGDDVCDPIDLLCGAYVEADCGADGNDPEGNALDPNGTDSNAYDLNLGTGGDQRTTVTVENLNGCIEDLDFFAFEIGEDGHGVTISVDFATDGATGGIYAFDASLDSEPIFAAETGVEDPTLDLTHGAAGPYLLAVQLQPQSESAPMDSAYTLTATYSSEGCTDIASCSDTAFGNFCTDGVCGNIEGEGTIAVGESCDSYDDCAGADGEEPTADCFTDGANPASWVCVSTTDCTEDDAADCGSGLYCNESAAYCVPNCVDDEYCSEDTFCYDEGSGLACISRECYEDETCTERTDRPEGEVCVVGNQSIAGQCAVPEDPPACAGNDGNDRDATATELTLAEGTASSTGASLCDGDIDVYSVTIAEVGKLAIAVTYDGPTDSETPAADLDAFIIAPGSERAVGFAATYPEEGETITEDGEARFLAAGEYLIRVVVFGELAETTDYTLTVTFEAESCSADADCNVTSPLFSVCNDTDGNCEDFDGDGAQAYGESCDDDGDCADGNMCYFDGEGASFRNFCTPLCFTSDDCEEGDSCVEFEYSYFGEGYCDPS